MTCFRVYEVEFRSFILGRRKSREVRIEQKGRFSVVCGIEKKSSSSSYYKSSSS